MSAEIVQHFQHDRGTLDLTLQLENRRWSVLLFVDWRDALRSDDPVSFPFRIVPLHLP